MDSLNHLLTVQIFAILVAVVGEIAASELLLTVAIGTFFIAFVAMFVQMTTALLVGLGQSDGSALAA
ncbi:hypothetical protein [Salinibaculum rarum]|jgi:hypothetical protein|uniref:hypothetical protein n=1 Tax=Salinibaculum rarum TaxID=3058903 RepID=UPI0026601C01|nr:hypothetical protein [Salinibaculum sp. KK48]